MIQNEIDKIYYRITGGGDSFKMTTIVDNFNIGYLVMF